MLQLRLAIVIELRHESKAFVRHEKTSKYLHGRMIISTARSAPKLSPGGMDRSSMVARSMRNSSRCLCADRFHATEPTERRSSGRIFIFPTYLSRLISKASRTITRLEAQLPKLSLHSPIDLYPIVSLSPCHFHRRHFFVHLGGVIA